MTATTFLSRNPTTGKIEEILGLSNSDAFGRSRVSSPATVFDLSHLYDKQPLYIQELTASGGTSTHLPNEAAVSMAVTTTIGSRVVRQTRRYFSYQPGKSLLVMLTGVLANVETTSIRSRIGFFDDAADKTVDAGGNGIFFEYSGGITKIVKRSFISGVQVDTAVAQGSWSEGDQLDGLGKSGKIFDVTKAQIFWVDLEWLGVGTVRCGVVIDGQFITLHKFHHANIINSVYMTRASLPVRYEIRQMTGVAAASMKQMCCSVQSEGGYETTGRVLSRAMVTPVTVNTTTSPEMSIRLKAGYNRAALRLRYADLMITANQSITYQILYGATLTGPTNWVSVDTTNSGVEYDQSSTGYSGGRVIESGFLSASNRQVQIPVYNTFDAPGCDIAGNTEAITMIITSTGNASAYISMTWQESH